MECLTSLLGLLVQDAGSKRWKVCDKVALGKAKAKGLDTNKI